MKKNLTRCKVAVYFFIICILWVFVENILQIPKNDDWNMRGIEKVKEKPQYYDILFSGTSMTIINLSPEEMYVKYGIAGISLGEPEQIPFLSYYTIEEALKYQSPKAILFDVKALFYSIERQKEMIEENEDYYIHYTLDAFGNSKTKYDAVSQVKELNPDTTYMSYFSKMFHNHSNWEEVSERNFKTIQTNDFMLEGKNLFGMWENVSDNSYISIEDNAGEKQIIPEINVVYLEKMAELCKKKNVDLILIRGTGSKVWSWGEYNAVSELANKLGVDYLDLALYEEAIKFDWKTDSVDGFHHNVIGTKKWTDFLGEYLISKYKFADRREDKEYKEFEEQTEKYQNVIKAMSQKICLTRAINFAQYIDTLYNMDKEDTAILIAVNDDASASLTLSKQNMLDAIGFHIDLQNKLQGSYYGVLDDGKIVAEKSGFNIDDTSDILSDGTKYCISSGGLLSGKAASISIDGQEQIQGGRGFNIVVYNKKCKTVLSSVFFDTNSEENPTTARMVDSRIIEKEYGTNSWINN